LLLLRSGPELKISTTMRVLHIAGLAIIFAVVRSTTSTASGQRWANKPYENPGGYARPPTMRPNVHAPRIHKRDVIPTSIFGSSGIINHQFANNDGFVFGLPNRHSPLEFHNIQETFGAAEANIHKPPHTGMTSMMSGQHSQPESTETMTDDHKPGPISETPLMSSEADSEEHIMPPVMTEDDAMMPGKEFTNAPESNEAMNEEMSGHNYISNYISVPEFKEVLHELVQDAVKNVVDKIIEKYLIRHDGEATGRDPQSCAPVINFAGTQTNSHQTNTHHINNKQQFNHFNQHNQFNTQQQQLLTQQQQFFNNPQPGFPQPGFGQSG